MASVELTPSEQPRTADRLPLAVAPIVLTVTSVDGVDAVMLLREGAPVDVPLPGGEQVSRPVTAAQYQSLLAPRTARTQAPSDSSSVPPPTNAGTGTGGGG